MANGHRGTRMSKQWAAIPSIDLTFTADGTSLGGALAFTVPSTVIRMLGDVTIGNTAAVTALDAVIIGMSIGVVSTDAFAAGAASVPEPLEEPEYPWLYWASKAFFYPNTSSPLASTGDPRMSDRFSIDIRSQRKLKPRESLCWIVQYGDITGAPPMTVQIANTRVLLALH